MICLERMSLKKKLTLYNNTGFIVIFKMFLVLLHFSLPLSVQILESQDFEEFPSKLQEAPVMSSSQGPISPSGLDSLGLGLSSTGVVMSGTSSGLGLELGAGIEFNPGVCASSLDPETQRRLSLQEPQMPLDSRTPQRHSSDPGGS